MTTLVYPTLLSHIYQGVRRFGWTWPKNYPKVVLRRPNNFKLSNTVEALVYTIVTEYDIDDCVLTISGDIVARGRLEIMLWAIENAPRELQEGMRLLIEWEKHQNEKELV